MRILRLAVKALHAARRAAIGVCLAVAGCGDSTELPPDVEAHAREREEAEQKALDELERRRKERPPAISPGENVIEPTDSPTADTATTAASPGALPDDGAGNERPIPAEDNADAGEALSIDLPPLPMLPTSPARREKTAAAKWDQMRAGMTTSEVENLLGAPTNRSVDLYLTYWYYGTGRDAGRVAFITSSQRTMAWDPPLR